MIDFNAYFVGKPSGQPKTAGNPLVSPSPKQQSSFLSKVVLVLSLVALCGGICSCLFSQWSLGIPLAIAGALALPFLLIFSNDIWVKSLVDRISSRIKVATACSAILFGGLLMVCVGLQANTIAQNHLEISNRESPTTLELSHQPTANGDAYTIANTKRMAAYLDLTAIDQFYFRYQGTRYEAGVMIDYEATDNQIHLYERNSSSTFTTNTSPFDRTEACETLEKLLYDQLGEQVPVFVERIVVVDFYDANSTERSFVYRIYGDVALSNTSGEYSQSEHNLYMYYMAGSDIDTMLENLVEGLLEDA